MDSRLINFFLFFHLLGLCTFLKSPHPNPTRKGGSLFVAGFEVCLLARTSPPPLVLSAAEVSEGLGEDSLKKESIKPIKCKTFSILFIFPQTS